jgi:hypothetical protein
MKAKGLLTRGHVVLPRAALPAQAMAREVLRGLPPDGEPGLREWRLFARKTGWNAAAGKTLPGYLRVKEFARALTTHLHGLLPDESFELDVVHLRQTTGLPAYTNHPHFDSSYLTASCALAGPGTALYWRDAAGVHKRGTATGSTAVISGQRREASTGLASTIHSAPFGKMKRRVVLVIFFTRTGSSAGLSLRRKLKAEQKFFQDHFDAPDPEVRLKP